MNFVDDLVLHFYIYENFIALFFSFFIIKSSFNLSLKIKSKIRIARTSLFLIFCLLLRLILLKFSF